MSIASNILRRKGSAQYNARIAVPLDLRDVVGKCELWRSLKTTDPIEARKRGGPVIAAWLTEFDRLRRLRELTPNDLTGAAWEHYSRELEYDRRERNETPTAAAVEAARVALYEKAAAGAFNVKDPLAVLDASLDFLLMRDHAGMSREARAKRLALVRKHLADGETALIEWAADDYITRKGLLVEKDTHAYRDLCRSLQRAELEALERAQERDTGNWTGTPRDPLIAPPASEAVMQAPPGESIMNLFDRFARERVGSASLDTWRQNRKVVTLFAEFLGEGAHISTVRRRTVREWKEALFRWPIKVADTNAFAGLSFRAVIEANEKIGKPTIAPKTVNKYLAALGSFAQWLLANEHITEDVMRGMYLTLDKSERKRLPYSPDQLAIIFGSPLFTGCKGERHEHEPGDVRLDDWRFWIPLIALFTGARLGEIAQLLTGDVREMSDIWCFHITREGSRLKSVKTPGSERVIPVHPELIRLGFLDYHAAMVRKSHKQLFPELKPDARGFYSGVPSKWFNGYFRAIDVKADATVSFHSFRHGIADAFRSAGFLDEQFAGLLGHGKATTTGRYGIVPEGALKDRLKMIEAVSFPTVDFRKLRWISQIDSPA